MKWDDIVIVLCGIFRAVSERMCVSKCKQTWLSSIVMLTCKKKLNRVRIIMFYVMNFSLIKL